MEHINSIEGIALESVPARALRIHFFTGRGDSQGSGQNKVHTYRTGVQTDLGDIEASVWIDAVKSVIHRDGRDDELTRLAGIHDMSRLLSDNLWINGRDKHLIYQFSHVLEAVLMGG